MHRFWFTEGFDTKDLQEAKGLLDELAETALSSFLNFKKTPKRKTMEVVIDVAKKN